MNLISMMEIIDVFFCVWICFLISITICGWLIYIERWVLLRCRGSFLSSGLQPKQPQILQPDDGSLVFRTSSGTWHKHDLFDFENAFIHFLQQPFLASNYTCSFSFFTFFFSPGLYSGSSPRLIKSSLEHPLHPQV